MKIFRSILRVTAGVLVMLVSFFFAVVEGTLLFTGDFLLYEDPFVAFVQLCLRVLIPVLAFAAGLFSLIKRHRNFWFEGLCMLTASIAAAPFISSGFGMYFILIAAFFTASCLLDRSYETA